MVNRANSELVGPIGDSHEAVDIKRDDSAQWELYFPPPVLCTDNGVMSAWAGVERLWAKVGGKGVGGIVKYNDGMEEDLSEMEPIARWPLGPTISNTDKGLFRKRKVSKKSSTRKPNAAGVK